MAEKSNQSIVARCLKGKAREGTFGEQPESRYRLYIDLVKGRLGWLVLVNLILLVAFAPVVLVYIGRMSAVMSMELTGPFGSGLMLGYPIDLGAADYAERMIFYFDSVYFALLIPSSLIFALGISGAAYFLRNFICTAGKFTFRDFYRGIRRNYLGALGASILFTAVLYLAQMTADLANWYLVLGRGPAGALIFSEVIGYLVLVLFMPVCLWMAALSTDFKLGAWGLVKSSFVMTFRLFPQSLLFAAFVAVPVALVLFTTDFWLMILLAVFLLLGLSCPLLAWMNFAQWAYARFSVLPAPAGEGKAQPREQPQPEPLLSKEEQLRRVSVAYGKSELLSRPIPPLFRGTAQAVLPEAFTRADLLRLAESRAAVARELAAYEEAHGGEEKYLRYNQIFDEREKALEDGKKKRATRPPKMLNRR